MLSIYGIPVVFVKTEGEQIRKHHKKRINKKWKKRYGCHSGTALPDGKIMLVDIPGASKMIMMTKNTLKMLGLSKTISTVRALQGLRADQVFIDEFPLRGQL